MFDSERRPLNHYSINNTLEKFLILTIPACFRKKSTFINNQRKDTKNLKTNLLKLEFDNVWTFLFITAVCPFLLLDTAVVKSLKPAISYIPIRHIKAYFTPRMLSPDLILELSRYVIDLMINLYLPGLVFILHLHSSLIISFSDISIIILSHEIQSEKLDIWFGNSSYSILFGN